MRKREARARELRKRMQHGEGYWLTNLLPEAVQLVVLGCLPRDDTFAFYCTCRSFRCVVLRYNQIRTHFNELRLPAKAVQLPPTAHLVKSVPLYEWAKDEFRFGQISLGQTRSASSAKVSEWQKGLCAAAAAAGNLLLLQLLRRRERFAWDSWTCANAALHGQLSVLQWARLSGCPWDEVTPKNAARYGHVEVLQWALANECPWWENTTSNVAAQAGHFEAVKFCIKHSCVSAHDGEGLCALAARRGDVSMLKWLRARGCDWDSHTCEWAAANGHLEVLKFARDGGCNWDFQTCRRAGRSGHVKCLEYALANGCFIESTTRSLFVDSGGKDLFKIEAARFPELDSEYMTRQNDINWRMRTILIDWLTDVHRTWDLMPQTLYVAVSLLDRFLERKENVPRTQLQLIGATAMQMVCWYEEIWTPKGTDWTYISDNAFTVEELNQMELSMREVLGDQLRRAVMNLPTVLSFLEQFCSVTDVDAKAEQLAKYYAESMLVESSMLKYPPSVTMSAALCLAMAACRSGGHTAGCWPASCARISGYDEASLVECMTEIALLVAQKKRRPTGPSISSEHWATERKYESARFLEVAFLPLPIVDQAY